MWQLELPKGCSAVPVWVLNEVTHGPTSYELLRLCDSSAVSWPEALL